MRKTFVLVLILISILLGLGIEWSFAKKAEIRQMKPLFREGKSLIVVGKARKRRGRWKIEDQSEFFSGHSFIFLENTFLEKILVENYQNKAKDLIIRGRYHFFQGQSYLFPTHLHEEKDLEKRRE